METDRALFVLYEFPPESPRATKRSVKFIRYLPDYHWSAVVLTVRSRNFMFNDKSLLAELPADLSVYRAWTLENIVRKDPGAQATAGKMAGAAKKAPSASALRRAVLWLYQGIGSFTRIPDSRILWLPFAVSKGLRAIRQQAVPVDLLLGADAYQPCCRSRFVPPDRIAFGHGFSGRLGGRSSYPVEARSDRQGQCVAGAILRAFLQAGGLHHRRDQGGL